MYYVQNGKEKNWDLLKVHDSVSIIILNKTRNKLVFVKQFRPGELCCCFLFRQLKIVIHVRLIFFLYLKLFIIQLLRPIQRMPHRI